MIYAIEWLRMPRDPFSGHLDMLLLAALSSRSMHGYAIIEYVRAASAGHFDYAEGTIYPALRRLEDDGLVRSRWSMTDGRRRRIYDLSAQGAKALSGHRREWEQFTNGVEAVLGHG
jgi:PadR family transcriptional regulator, regulatory protein PadR